MYEQPIAAHESVSAESATISACPEVINRNTGFISMTHHSVDY